MKQLTALLDSIPLATYKALAGDVIIVVAYLNGTLSLDAALIASGVVTAGAGVLGKARADSGKGLKS